MKYRQMSIRFDMRREEDRRAWEYLHRTPDPHNRLIVAALNAYAGHNGSLEELVRRTIRECLSGIAPAAPQQPPEEADARDEMMASLGAFLGDE